MMQSTWVQQRELGGTIVPEFRFVECINNKILYFEREAGGYATFLPTQPALGLIPEALPLLNITLDSS